MVFHITIKYCEGSVALKPACWSVGRSVGRSVGWLVGWLVSRYAGRLVG